LLAAGEHGAGDLGWDGGEHVYRFDVEQLPLADGRFHLRFSLTGRGGRIYHWLDDALVFVVYSGAAHRGILRLEGRWSREEIAQRAEIGAG